jgi:hypothetical protein
VNQEETFTTDATVVDSTVSEFPAGTPGSDTYVGATGSGADGEVVLKPTVGEDSTAADCRPAGRPRTGRTAAP